MKNALLIVLLTLGCAVDCRAATFYLDWTNGADSAGRDGSNGTSQAWKTLSYACGRASRNDTIHLDANLNYVDRSRCNLAPGVTIEGAGVDTTRITADYASGDGNGYIHSEQESQNVFRGNNEISGFTLDGSSKTLGTGIWIRGYDHINIHDMKFQHINSHAIVLAGYTGWSSFKQGMLTPPAAYGHGDVIHDVRIDDCSTKTTVKYDDRYGAVDLEGLADSKFYNMHINENYPGHGTGIKAVPGWLSNVKFYNNTILNNESDPNCFAMEVYNLINGSEIYGNKFRHLVSLNGGPVQAVGTWNLKIHHNDFKLPAGDESGNEFSHNNVDIYQNYFHDGTVPAAGIWTTNGLTGAYVRNWRFHHNVVYNTSNGILMVSQSSAAGSNNIEVYNNVFDTMTGNPWGGYGFNGEALSGSCRGVTVKNNIFRNCAAGPANFKSFTNVVFDHNLLHGNGNNDAVREGTAGIHNKVAVPGFAGISHPDLARPDAYYAVTGKASNLYGSGADVGLPFKSKAPGIGPYEYVPATPPTAPRPSRQRHSP